MDLHPETLTWTGLLAQWVQFAQASLALPDEADGPRWRASVPAIINLQAVTFALADVHRLPRDEQALALDKADLLIGAASDDLRAIWRDDGMASMVREIMDDAVAALRASQRNYDARAMTMIAASIAVHEPGDVGLELQRAQAAVNAGARLVEWRVDGLAEHAAEVLKLVRESPAPCIVTCRAEWEGGDYRGDEATRAALFETLLKAESRPRYIDVEWSALMRDPQSWRAVRDLLQSQSERDLHTSLVLSTHDFNGRPADLLQRVEAMANDPLCAVVKVAWAARSLRDNLEAFDLVRDRHKPMIAICMGPFGLLSRVLARKFGGLLTFAVHDEAEVTGPGQPTIGDLLNLYRSDRIGPQTRVYGVIGWPISHSQSPAIHNAGFSAIGFDGVYLPLPIPPEYEHFKATVGSLVDHAGVHFRGASVTLPHKENLLRFVRERGGRIDPITERIGAANTIVVGSAGGLECLNTDCPAAVESLCAGMGIDRDGLKGKRVAVIGAGGVARAVIAGLSECGAEVVIFNRSFDTASHLAAEFGGDERGVTAAPLESIVGGSFDVIVNGTPIGMHGGPAPNDLPIPADVHMDDSTTVFDTVYAPARTPLIKEAESRGARVIAGLDMFIRQAALQFERWTGVPAPLETFRKALERRPQS